MSIVNKLWKMGDKVEAIVMCGDQVFNENICFAKCGYLPLHN
jgi:hypothetical protein